MNSYRSFFLLLAIFLSGGILKAQDTAARRYPLIPYPVSLKAGQGSFVIGAHTRLVRGAGSDIFSGEISFLQAMLKRASEAGPVNSILIEYSDSFSVPESYSLSVTASRITLRAKDPAGLFMGIQTLRQLMPPGIESQSGQMKTIPVPVVEINDRPAFPWRGMMLDVSRHFFSVSYVKKFIDRMALYKMNKLHLHLTDDEGWRIEIKKYPALTEKGAWRTFDRNDSAVQKLARETGNPDFIIDTQHIRQVNGKTQYGGFYTQEEMKGIIAYAAARHIEIIPELDMPGHMRAATAQFAGLTGAGHASNEYGFSDPLCPCNEETLRFATDIYTEIAALFPSKYMHIGGDEVNRSSWETAPACKTFMEQQHITGTDKLQSWFTRYMEQFFRSKGKILIGWDEILDGGIDSSAVVMWWRTWAKKAPEQAAQNHNEVIMTPDGPFYFDAWPDHRSLNAVYNYPLMPAGLDPALAGYILGPQGNLWTERVPSEARADYLVMPRMTALAESGWTNTAALYGSYLQRLNGQYTRMDKMGIHYDLPGLGVLPDHSVFTGDTTFFIEPPLKGFTIRYTEDGHFPTLQSPLLVRPLKIDRTLTLKIAVFSATGRRGDMYTLYFDKQPYAPAVTVADPKPGLKVGWYNGSYPNTTQLGSQADSVFIADKPAFDKDLNGRPFGLKFRGYIDVPQTGIYTFYLNSDDGSVLRIAGRTVVDNDGLHSATEKSGQVALAKGLQPVELDFIEGGGGYTLELRYSIGGSQPALVPAEWCKQP